MNVIGIDGNSNGIRAFYMKSNEPTDAVSKNIKKKIEDMQKRLQELGENTELSLEENMKKRQEIQQQISELQNQLRQHEIEVRKESRQKKSSSMDEMLGGSRNTDKKGKNTQGMSSAGMQAIIAADAVVEQAEVAGNVRREMEGRAGVLEGEIRQDHARGWSVESKKEELAAIEEKAQNAEVSQIKSLSDVNKKLEETAESEDKADDKIDDEDKTAKESEGVSAKTGNKQDITTDKGTSDVVGTSVDIKL